MNTRYWFERYAASQGYSVERNPDGTYLNIIVESMWVGWQMGYGRKL